MIQLVTVTLTMPLRIPQGRKSPGGVDYVNYRAELTRARKRLDVAMDVRVAAIADYEEGLWRATMALRRWPGGTVYEPPPAPPPTPQVPPLVALPTPSKEPDMIE